MKPTRNSEVLQDFVHYCRTHPDERFWQALRNWCGWSFVEVTDDSFYCFGHVLNNDRHYVDTFDWEGRNQ